MSSLFSDWASQATPELRLERLRLRLGVVTEMLKPNTSIHDHSTDRAPIVAEYQELMKELRRLEDIVASTPTNSNRFLHPVMFR